MVEPNEVSPLQICSKIALKEKGEKNYIMLVQTQRKQPGATYTNN
jgi:hypothetical protein